MAASINAVVAAFMLSSSFSGGYDPGEIPVLPDRPPVTLHPPQDLCKAFMKGADVTHPDPQSLPPETLHIRKADGTLVTVQVEVARTPEQHAIGMMYREEVPAGTGMLFVNLPGGAEGGVWMKDTYVPLDIVFVDKDGKIVKIHENAAACDMAQIPGGPGAYAILELPAGAVDAYGLAEGDQLLHPDLVKKTSAPQPPMR